VANVIAPRGLTVDKDDHAWVIGKVEEMIDGKKARTNAILRIAPDGASTVVAKGEPLDFPHTIALDDQGNAYVVDNYAKALFKISSAGEKATLVKGEPFKSPVGLCRHGDGLLVADPHAKAVFRVTFDGMVTPVKLE
jgi:sugar lactone lactonase YvrE